MTTNWQSFLWKLRVTVPILTGSLVGFIGTHAVAQITPDATLGNEASQVKPINDKVDRIDGGAVRGSNLFHSFQDFNVGEGRGAYFANPAGVENILSRVTGNNPSNIFGTLGVLGNANLYLLNPNGIIFGQNAKLDIRGSFVGSAAGGVIFNDRTFFGADKSQTTPLLTMAVPVGLQYGTQQAGNISNTGNLAVGQDLTLSASNLDLQGKLEAGRNLTLQANNTVRVRDSVESPFLARANGNLLIQGNQGIDILALNHPGTPFQSGGNLSLVSDGIISGDAHFASGGNFLISNLEGKPGNFVSLYDPIINATGDVTFGDYTGVALKVEATGSITGGNVRITEADTSLRGSDPDIPILTSSPALILRSGLTTLSNASNVPQSIEGTNFTPTGLQSRNGGITVRNIDTSSNVSNGGSVTLSSSGDITTGFIKTAPDNSENLATVRIKSFNGSVKITNFTEEQKDSVFARSITIDAPGILDITGDLNTRINSSQNTGSITIGKSIPPSSISINTIGTRNLNGGEGGNIDITTTGLLNIKGIFSRGLEGIPLEAIDSSNTTNDILSIGSEANGNGGDITINAGGGIKTAAGIVSNSRTLGNGGNITLNSGDGAITIEAGTVDSSSQSGNGGAIKFDAAGNITTPSILSNSRNGKGGDINLISRTGLINTLAGTVNSSSNSDNGGKITFDAASNISAGNIFSNSNGFGRGGDITFTSRAGLINTLAGTVSSFSNIGTGGTITFDTAGNITTANILSYSGVSGKGGDTTLTSRVGTINTSAGILNASSGNTLNPFFPELGISPGNGGNVTLTAKENIFSGSIESVGLLGGNINLTSGDKIFINNNDIATISTGSGVRGQINLTGKDILIRNARIGSLTAGKDDGGNIIVRASDKLEIKNEPESTTTVTGGSPLFEFLKGIEGIGIITTTLFGTGKSGDINIETRQFAINNKAPSNSSNLAGVGTLTLDDSSNNAGNVKITALESVDITGNNPRAFSLAPSQDLETNKRNARSIQGLRTGITSATQGSGNAGQIQIETGRLSMQNGAAITSGVTDEGTGQGNNIIINPNFNPNSSVELQDTSAIATASIGGSQSNATNLTVNAGTIKLSNESVIAADTLGAGQGGNLNIDTNQLNILSASRVSAATFAGGQGGTVTINSPQRKAQIVNIDGNLPDGQLPGKGQARSGIFTDSRGANSKAGNIDIFTNRLNIENRGEISVSSFETGFPGNLTITADSIDLNRQARINSSTEFVRGGNITLNVTGKITMVNNGDPINATEISSSASKNASGGNILFNIGPEGFILGNLFENSDVVAVTDGTGKGGETNADSAIKRVFRFRPFNLEPTPESDFTATSALGLDGIVRGTQAALQAQLPQQPVVRDIQQVCASSQGITTRQAGRSAFSNIGRGGLPPNPSDALDSNIPQVPWVTLDSNQENPTAANTTPSTTSKPEIEEAEGWVRQPNGKLMLTTRKSIASSSCIYQSSQQ